MVIVVRWLRPLIATFAVGCSSHELSAPPLADCGATGCHATSVGVGSGSVGTGGSATTDAGSGQVISAVVNPVIFAASSSDALAWSLSNVQPFSDPVEIDVLSSTGTVLTGTGSGPLAFDLVSTASNSWVTVRPTGTTLYLPGMLALAKALGPTVNVPLMLADDFSILSSLVRTPIVSLDMTKAQVVIKVVDAQGNGVRNARINDIGAAATAYSSSGSWIDSTSSPYTDLSGRVIMVNLAASTTPGTSANITATGLDSLGNTVMATAIVPIEAGFVSYAAVALVLN